MTRHPRCIAVPGGWRCPHRAARRNGDLFVCTRHGLITMALMEDHCSPPTRRMLAHARWQTREEGQALIDHMYRRSAA